jgi:hypothetical protein
MTVAAETPINTYNANGSTTVFAYQFRIEDASELKIYHDEVEQTSGFSVSGIGNNGGGSVTYTTAPSSGTVVLFLREMPTTRTIDYQNSGDFRADTINEDIDRVWLKLQEIERELNYRTFQFDESEARTPAINALPSPIANQILRWDSDGSIKNSLIENLVTDIDISSTIDRYDSVAALIAASPDASTVYLTGYYGGWAATVAGPIGGHYRHKTGATNTSPTVGSAVAVSTVGTGNQAGYCWDAAGNEWRISVDREIYTTWLGMGTSQSAADNKTAMDDTITFAFASRKPIRIPVGYYEIDPFTIVTTGTQYTLRISGDYGSRSGEIIPTSNDSIKQHATVLYFPNCTGTDIAIEVGASGGSGELHGPIIEHLYMLGPTLEAGTPTNNNTGLRITDGARDMIIRDVHISQFRSGLITNDVFVFTIENSKISRCQVGATWGPVSNRITALDLKITDCTYGAFHTGSGSVTYIEPWFEGQPPTSTREMEYAVVVGGSSSASADKIADITFVGGWYEQIQKEFIAVGWYDDGTGAGGGATPNLANSVAQIDRINVLGYGHWDSIGIDTGGTKVNVNASATNVSDGAVRIYSDLGNWDFSQVVGDATKVKSGNNFESHASNGYPIARWVTEKDDGASGGTNAGLKTALPDASATTFINFSIPNTTIGGVFRITYEIITNTERSVCAGDVLVTLGRKSGSATQGGVGTVNNTIVNIASTESNSAPTFALTGIQAKDTADTTTETIGLQVTQDNSNSSDATISYTVEQVSGTRQAGVGSNYITVSQA